MEFLISISLIWNSNICLTRSINHDQSSRFVSASENISWSKKNIVPTWDQWIFLLLPASSSITCDAQPPLSPPTVGACGGGAWYPSIGNRQMNEKLQVTGDHNDFWLWRWVDKISIPVESYEWMVTGLECWDNNAIVGRFVMCVEIKIQHQVDNEWWHREKHLEKSKRAIHLPTNELKEVVSSQQ